MKIAVLIRVYDRIDDLRHNLEIISRTWKRHDYHIIVVSNGISHGYDIPLKSKALINKLVILEENAGHRKGNSQLLLEGMQHIPAESEFTLILEADTWAYTDNIIDKYANILKVHPTAVWASADWYDKSYALATDFALIKTEYLLYNPGLFDFELFPECHISNYLRDNDDDFIWITENMPVHVPSYIKLGYPYIPNIKEARFYVFPKSKMVTHHVEYLSNGMEKKKEYFNIVANRDFFKFNSVKFKTWERFKMKFWIGLSKFFIKKSWFQKKYYFNIPEE